LRAWFATDLNFLDKFPYQFKRSGFISLFAPQIAPQNDAQKAR